MSIFQSDKPVIATTTHRYMQRGLSIDHCVWILPLKQPLSQFDFSIGSVMAIKKIVKVHNSLDVR